MTDHVKVEDRGGTHYDGCWLDHHDCAVEMIERDLAQAGKLVTDANMNTMHGELREARALLRELSDAICRVGDWGENTRVGDVLERVEKFWRWRNDD